MDTFTLWAGERRRMTEGKGEWTEPEERNERLMGKTSRAWEFTQKTVQANGCNFYIGWVYTQFLEIKV